MTEANILTAFILGLLGSTHCVGMCGGLAVALGLHGQAKLSWLLGYNAGRIATYTVLGALCGYFGAGIVAVLPLAGPLLRSVAGLLLIAMGLYLGQWWLGLTRLEQLGGALWRPLQPLASRLIPVKSLGGSITLGVVWGWLPCGLVYSTLSWALASAEPARAAWLMAGFGLGTLPAMLATGLAGQRLLAALRHRQARRIAGALVIALGVVTAALPWLHGGHGAPSDENRSGHSVHAHAAQ